VVGYFLKVELDGINSTIELAPCSETHTFPFLSTAIPTGETSETEDVNSWKLRDAKSNRAILLAKLSVTYRYDVPFWKAISAGPEFEVGRVNFVI